MVLFEPVRSAEPPIRVVFFSAKAVKIFSEDFLVAIVSELLIIFCFSVSRVFLNSFEKNFSTNLFFFL